jgi:hypothetical protein
MVTLDLEALTATHHEHIHGEQASAFVQLRLLDLVRFPVATAATLTFRAQTVRPGRLRRVLSSGAVYDILSGDSLRRSRSRSAASQFARALAISSHINRSYQTSFTKIQLVA